MPASSTQITASSRTLAPLPPVAPVVAKTSGQEALKKEATKHQPIQNQPIHKPQPIQNRVQVLLVHIPKFSIQGQARLAAEVGVSPSYRLARGVTDALERMLRKPLDMREVFSTDGTYLTPSGCALCQCGGCLPDRAYDPEGNLRPEWQGQHPGDWSVAPSAGSGPSANPSSSADPSSSEKQAASDGSVHGGNMDDGKETR